MPRLVLASADADLSSAWQRALIGHDALVPTSPKPGALLPEQAAADIALIDLRGEPDALIADWHRRHPVLRLMAMVPVPDPDQGLALLTAGARGYCNRRMSAELLCVAVAAVSNDEIWAGKLVMQRLLAQRIGAPAGSTRPDSLARLTERERDVAQGVARGVSSKVLAADLGISERTIKAHLSAIYRKTGCRNRTQLALAVNRRFPPPPDIAGGSA